MSNGNDPNPQLRLDLLAALAVLGPEIQGLEDMLSAPNISNDLRAAIQGQILNKQRRSNLIQTVITDLNTVEAALNSLDADGYPNLPVVALPSALQQELSGLINDISAASSVFAGPPVSITTDMTQGAHTIQPVPQKPGP